jgi:nicotine blue oxidoreductase
MGRPKPLLPLHDSTYLETLVATVSAAGARPLVVLGAGADEVRSGVDLSGAETLHNTEWRGGMLTSVQAAVRHLQEDETVRALLLVPVDQPRIAISTFRRLIDAWRERPTPVAVAAFQGRRGHPALFSRGVWSELLAAPHDEGARAVAQAHAPDRLVVDVDDPWVVVDADTPADHTAMREGRLPD